MKALFFYIERVIVKQLVEKMRSLEERVQDQDCIAQAKVLEEKNPLLQQELDQATGGWWADKVYCYPDKHNKDINHIINGALFKVGSTAQTVTRLTKLSLVETIINALLQKKKDSSVVVDIIIGINHIYFNKPLVTYIGLISWLRHWLLQLQPQLHQLPLQPHFSTFDDGFGACKQSATAPTPAPPLSVTDLTYALHNAFIMSKADKKEFATAVANAVSKNQSSSSSGHGASAESADTQKVFFDPYIEWGFVRILFLPLGTYILLIL